MNPSPPAQPQRQLEFFRPAITGGIFLGVLSTVPFFNLGCCLWLLAGGGMAAFLVNRQRPGQLKLGDGALAGVSAGLVGTIVSTVLSIPIQSAMYTAANIPEIRKQLDEWSTALELPPDFVKQMEPMLTPGFSATRLVAWAICFSIVSGLFAMIGGILTVAMLNRQKNSHGLQGRKGP
jgi:hypothetical protein